MAEWKVELHVYDLSKGMAKYLGFLLVDKHVEGIWHTSIVVYSNEYTYGNDGVNVLTCPENPVRVEELGYTSIPPRSTDKFVDSLSENKFTVENYDLFSHNCHHFANELSLFLCGTPIPRRYLHIPQEILGDDVKAGAKRIAIRSGLAVSALAVACATFGAPILAPLLLVSTSSSLSSMLSSSSRKKN